MTTEADKEALIELVVTIEMMAWKLEQIIEDDSCKVEARGGLDESNTGEV